MANNVLGQLLAPCSHDPKTGWLRDGCCNTDERDRGNHVICAVMSESFLEFSKSRGNDLSTPRPEFQFPGLNPGDQWCLCATRWKEALEQEVAPSVVLEATHESALDIVTLEDLMRHADLAASH
jgi:uncharacterized protein (DUF2237 family)